MSTLGAQAVHMLSLAYPETGGWRGDVILTGGAAPAVGARLTLTAGDLALLGTVQHSDNDAPDRPHVVIVGGLGWDRAVIPDPGTLGGPSYQDDSGVRLSTVLHDLAARAGEPIEYATVAGTPLPDVVIGDHWSAPAAIPGQYLRLRDVLAALYEQGYVPPWRVDPDGVTRFGLRVGAAVSARATIIRRDLGVGLRIVGLDSPAAFLPGGSVEGAVIRRLVVNETPGSLTAELWSDARLTFRSRILRMVAEAFPSLFYGFPRTYRVAAVRTDGRLDLAPPPDAAHLQPLPAVEPWTLGGAQVVPVVGSPVLVHFRDALPSRPVVLAFPPVGLLPAPAPPNASTPPTVTLDASATLALGPSAAAVHLAVGPASIPHAAAFVSSHAGRLASDSAGVPYYAPSEAGPYAALPSWGSPGPPPNGFAGVAVTVTTGSGKVSIA